MRKIIDVSCAQGFIHWPIIPETVDSVILKAADGHFEDNRNWYSYTDNRMKADRYGVKIEGVYGWWYPSRVDQTTQSMADVLWKLACGVRMILDLELHQQIVWKPEWKVDVKNHLDALDQLGGKPTVAYIGAPMAFNLMNKDGSYPGWLINRPIYWAQYPTRINWGDQWNMKNYGFKLPTNIPIKLTTNPWLWQFSGNGVIPGIPGNSVDLNYELNPL
jgi:GH25 family lysozyme M1 (1,4-beta-N-acetylmuramidase)